MPGCLRNACVACAQLFTRLRLCELLRTLWALPIPANARIIRNIIEAIQFVQDHVVHFYHLHAVDWVDVVSALGADVNNTSALAQSISDWPNSSPAYFQSVKDRLQAFAGSGQLGIFANAYWGHPAYRLPPKANLLAVAHYLEALDWQRDVIKMHAILGGKNPHPQTYLVGGMASVMGTGARAAINPTTIGQLRSLAAQALAFVQKVYIPDLLLIASFYKDWTNIGAGVGNFLSYGDFPQNDAPGPGSYWLQQGIVLNQNLAAPPQPLNHAKIKEYVAHSWYAYSGGDSAGKHPYLGETRPNYTGPASGYQFLDTNAKYSWLKAPRYNEAAMEVGPLARMVVAYAAGHARVRQAVNDVLATLQIPASALFSTLGRVAARGIETLVLAEQIGPWIDQLTANLSAGNTTIHNGAKWEPSTWPLDAQGWGTTESPRGALGHWIRIKNGKIANYQAVVATTWNGSPRDAANQRGAWEQALIGTPVVDADASG